MTLTLEYMIAGVLLRLGMEAQEAGRTVFMRSEALAFITQMRGFLRDEHKAHFDVAMQAIIMDLDSIHGYEDN